MTRVRCLATIGVLAAALAGCGGGAQLGGFTYENTLTGSTPVCRSRSPQAPLMQSIVNGEILALRQAGGRARGRAISFASLNDAATANGTWDGKEPRAAGQDLDAIAYIGDFDSAATAISLPLLNANDILQVSPASPYLGFHRIRARPSSSLATTRSQGLLPPTPSRRLPRLRTCATRVCVASTCSRTAHALATPTTRRSGR